MPEILPNKMTILAKHISGGDTMSPPFTQEFLKLPIYSQTGEDGHPSFRVGNFICGIEKFSPSNKFLNGLSIVMK